jgi:hypothetical protein
MSTNLRRLMYSTEGGLTIGPILFADDNLNPLSLPSPEDIRPLLQLYQEYQEVSGLNVNIQKHKLSVSTQGRKW